jgi:hypothetical protein
MREKQVSKKGQCRFFEKHYALFSIFSWAQ